MTTETTETTTAPEIDLARLTAADMKRIIEASAGRDRALLNMELLDRSVEGGLGAIPLPTLPAYLKAIDRAIDDLFNPKD
jgi:hypothetical protein